jgi:NAD(P)-dependent dehydrogenase (short-subunit alcohol dehydrogenase family)
VDPLFDVSGRCVLLAGAPGALGTSLAEAFAKRGARIVAADLDAARAAALAAGLPGVGHAACALDISEEDSCRAAVQEALTAGGRLDVVINAVGLFETGPAADFDAAAFRRVLEVNVSGAFLLSRAGAAAMAEAGGGRIINLASVSSAVVNPGYAAYGASKAALRQLTRVLALEWAAEKVTVNAIGPAMTPTPLTETYLRDSGNYDYALGCIPLGRFGLPEDIVGAALLLASPAGAFITGQTIFVDGGRTCV